MGLVRHLINYCFNEYTIFIIQFESEVVFISNLSTVFVGSNNPVGVTDNLRFRIVQMPLLRTLHKRSSAGHLTMLTLVDVRRGGAIIASNIGSTLERS